MLNYAAALELVANHGELLKTCLFKYHSQWYEDLLEWSKSTNADDNRIGRRAMYKFLDTVMAYAKEIKESSDLNEIANTNTPSATTHSPEVLRFLNFFSTRFTTVLNTKDANRIELGVAVRGYGLLSAICSDQDTTKNMLKLLMKHVDSINQELESTSNIVDRYSSPLSMVTSYLESVANLLPSLKRQPSDAVCDNNSSPSIIDISEEDLDAMKRLTVLLIRFYPELSENQRSYSYISVQKIFDSLWRNHHVWCEPFIRNVYEQSLLTIVSCPTRAEVDILVESYNRSNPDKKKSAFRELGLKPVTFYAPFWTLLLSRKASISDSDSDSLRFDILMQWILNTIGKLDLSVSFEENEIGEGNVDPMEGAKANKTKDFQVFVNIVDFFQELLKDEKEIHIRFEKWVIIFANEMLLCIKNHTHVSGFYKILAVVFDAARSVQYFKKARLVS